MVSTLKRCLIALYVTPVFDWQACRYSFFVNTRNKKRNNSAFLWSQVPISLLFSSVPFCVRDFIISFVILTRNIRELRVTTFSFNFLTLLQSECPSFRYAPVKCLYQRNLFLFSLVLNKCLVNCPKTTSGTSIGSVHINVNWVVIIPSKWRHTNKPWLPSKA